MKFSILRVLFIFTTAIFLFSTCKKDNNSGNPSGIEQGTFTAKIDGVEFKPLIPLANIANLGSTLEAFSIAGTNSTLSLQLAFWVPSGSFFEETTYQHVGLDCTTVDRICASINILYLDNVNNPESASTDADNGSMEISFLSIDYRPGGSCIGTFSGVLIGDDQSVINVTDGKFNLKIEE